MDGTLLDGEVAGRIGGIGGGRVTMRGRFPHAGEPIERRRLRSLDQAIEGLHRLQFRHHLVHEAIRTCPRQIQHHAFRLGDICI